MNVVIIGAGPAGLYLAYLLKRRDPAHQVAIFEQNSPSATFGFGVVFSDRALDFLRSEDPHTHEAIAKNREYWRDITIVHRNQPVRIDGIGFAAIGRLRLLEILRSRVEAL